MKIKAMREVYAERGIRVMDYAWIDAPLDKIIKRRLLSDHLLRLPGLSWKIRREGGEDREHVPSALCFQAEGGERFELSEGFLYYHSIAELVEFIAERVDPRGQGPLSELARVARFRNDLVDRARIEEALEEGGGPRRRRGNYLHERSLPLKQFSDNEKADLVSIMHRGRTFWTLSLHNNDLYNVILAGQSFSDRAGYRLPRFIMVRALSEQRSPQLDEPPLQAFDGERMSWGKRLDELPPFLLDELDRNGAMFHHCDFDLLPLEHLECFAAVRMPPREELKSMIPEIGDCIERTEAPHPALARPALAFDSHYPISLPEKLELVDRPEAALWFLSRAVKGIFVPDQPGRMFPVNKLPEKESFQLLTRPRRMAAP